MTFSLNKQNGSKRREKHSHVEFFGEGVARRDELPLSHPTA